MTGNSEPSKDKKNTYVIDPPPQGNYLIQHLEKCLEAVSAPSRPRGYLLGFRLGNSLGWFVSLLSRLRAFAPRCLRGGAKGGDPTAAGSCHTSARVYPLSKGQQPYIRIERAEKLPYDLVAIAARNHAELTGIDREYIIDNYLFEFDVAKYTVRVHGK